MTSEEEDVVAAPSIMKVQKTGGSRRPGRPIIITVWVKKQEM